VTEMIALRAHHPGGPEVLVLDRVPVPVPAAGEVLVAVHAAAITFDELTWPETWNRDDGTSRTPVILSHEFSGVISEIGSGVTGFAPGDKVYGLIPFDLDGAAAEFVAVPAGDVAAKPSAVPHVVASALPMPGLTAWQALVDHAAVQPGETVLVLGGVDTVGGDPLRESFAVLRPGGRLITLSAPPPASGPTNTESRQRFSSSPPTQGSWPNWPRSSTPAGCAPKSRRPFHSTRAGQHTKAARCGAGARARPSSLFGTDERTPVTAAGKIVVVGGTLVTDQAGGWIRFANSLPGS